MEPLEIAINFIKVQVERGDTIEDIMNSQVGGGCREYHCSVNHNIFINGKRVPRDSLIVEKRGEEQVVFKLSEIVELIKQKEVQNSLFA